MVFGHGLDGASSNVWQQAGRKEEQYSATCVCVRGHAWVYVGDSSGVVSWSCPGYGAFVGVPIYKMTEGSALRQSSVPSILRRALGNGRKEYGKLAMTWGVTTKRARLRYVTWQRPCCFPGKTAED